LFSSNPSISSILDINDFMQIFPEKAKLLKSLQEYINKIKNMSESDAKNVLVQFGSSACSLEGKIYTDQGFAGLIPNVGSGFQKFFGSGFGFR
jgi:hypothetical protein